MVDNILWVLKAIILIETLTNVARSWGIFDPIRTRVKGSSDYLRRLLDCFECTSVWAAVFVVLYLSFFEITIITHILVLSRLACYLHLAWEYADAARAVKEGQI